MIHALKMFPVNTFGDIGLISGRALHQIGNSIYTSDAVDWPKQPLQFKAKAVINVKIICLE